MKVRKLVTWERFDVDEGELHGVKLKGLDQVRFGDGVTIETCPRGYAVHARGSKVRTEIPTGNVRFAIVEIEEEDPPPAKPLQQQRR